MTEGYGHNFEHFDRYVTSIMPSHVIENLHTLGTPIHGNYYPFLSKSNKWYAFFNKSYSDINIYDLETNKLVVDYFYESTAHVNVSTYVPAYSLIEYLDFTKQDGTHSIFADWDYETNEYSAMNTNNSIDVQMLRYTPIAFNAYTLWAADFEYYVDILDLNDIDNGNIKLIEKTKFTLPTAMNQVRNYISFDAFDLDSFDPSDIFTYNIKMLNETTLGRINSTSKSIKYFDFYSWDDIQKDYTKIYYQSKS